MTQFQSQRVSSMQRRVFAPSVCKLGEVDLSGRVTLEIIETERVAFAKPRGAAVPVAHPSRGPIFIDMRSRGQDITIAEGAAVAAMQSTRVVLTWTDADESESVPVHVHAHSTAPRLDGSTELYVRMTLTHRPV